MINKVKKLLKFVKDNNKDNQRYTWVAHLIVSLTLATIGAILGAFAGHLLLGAWVGQTIASVGYMFTGRFIDAGSDEIRDLLGPWAIWIGMTFTIILTWMM
jgi:hypothetical protein